MPKFCCIVRAVDSTGVEGELARILAEDLRMHWDAGSGLLRIAASWQDKADAMEQLSAGLLGIWHFRLFSDSRWITIGCNARTLTAALVSGLPAFVKFIRSQKVSDYNIGQWDCLGADEVQFIVMSSFVSYPSDSALSMVFEDTRLALIADDVKAAMQYEMTWLETRPARLWENVLAAFKPEWGWTVDRLRSEVLIGAHISAAYFNMKALAHVERYP